MQVLSRVETDFSFLSNWCSFILQCEVLTWCSCQLFSVQEVIDWCGHSRYGRRCSQQLTSAICLFKSLYFNLQQHVQLQTSHVHTGDIFLSLSQEDDDFILNPISDWTVCFLTEETQHQTCSEIHINEFLVLVFWAFLYCFNTGYIFLSTVLLRIVYMLVSCFCRSQDLFMDIL